MEYKSQVLQIQCTAHTTQHTDSSCQRSKSPSNHNHSCTSISPILLLLYIVSQCSKDSILILIPNNILFVEYQPNTPAHNINRSIFENDIPEGQSPKSCTVTRISGEACQISVSVEAELCQFTCYYPISVAFVYFFLQFLN